MIVFYGCRNPIPNFIHIGAGKTDVLLVASSSISHQSLVPHWPTGHVTYMYPYCNVRRQVGRGYLGLPGLIVTKTNAVTAQVVMSGMGCFWRCKDPIYLQVGL
jgi:hypothetical protein|eukprot:COSAG01_NODE_1149_length_11506_cov_141.610049_5_plen_103_part_00